MQRLNTPIMIFTRTVTALMILMIIAIPTAGQTSFSTPKERTIRRIQSLIESGRYSDAKSLIQTLWIDDEDLELRWLRAWLAYLTQDMNELQQLCSGKLTITDPEIPVCLAMQKRDNPKKYNRMLEKYVKQLPPNPKLIHEVAYRFRQLQMYEEALKIYRHGNHITGNQDLFTLDMIETLKEAGKPVEAVRQLMLYAMQNTPYREIATQEALLIASKDSTAAKAVETIIQELLSSSPATWLYETWIKIEEIQQDIKPLTRALLAYDKSIRARGYRIVSWCKTKLNEGEYTYVKQVINNLINNNYISTGARNELRYLLAQIGIKELEFAPSPQKAQTLATIFRQLNKPVEYAYILGVFMGMPDSALKILVPLKDKNRHNLQYLLVLGKVYMHSSNPWESIPVLMDALELTTRRTDRLRVRWELAMAGFITGNIEWASYQLEIIAGYPEEKISNDALRWLLLISEVSDSVLVHLGRGLWSAWQMDSSGVEVACELAQQADPFGITSIYCEWLRGELAYWTGNEKDLYDHWMRFIKNSNSSLREYLAWKLFAREVHHGNYKKARQILNLLIEYFPNSPYRYMAQSIIS